METRLNTTVVSSDCVGMAVGRCGPIETPPLASDRSFFISYVYHRNRIELNFCNDYL